MTATPAVHHLTGEIAPGALVAVVGPNGAGKSTLFRGIVGILKPLAGTVGLGGPPKTRDIAYLPQTADIDRILGYDQRRDYFRRTICSDLCPVSAVRIFLAGSTI